MSISPALALKTRTENNPRWIRGLAAGTTVVDTRDSVFVWEHNYYPQWYFPRQAINAELRDTGTTEDRDGLGTATIYDLVITGDQPSDGGQAGSEVVIEGAARSYRDSPIAAIRDLVKIDWDAMDTWKEEEVEVSIHPRSPYTRVDVLPSTRHVTVRIDGEVVADSTRPFILYETGLQARYYLPMDDVRSELLTPTDLSTGCPYKGTARYWNVTVNGTTHENVVWGYDNPLPEAALTKGLVCFYSERVDLTVE